MAPSALCFPRRPTAVDCRWSSSCKVLLSPTASYCGHYYLGRRSWIELTLTSTPSITQIIIALMPSSTCFAGYIILTTISKSRLAMSTERRKVSWAKGPLLSSSRAHLHLFPTCFSSSCSCYQALGRPSLSRGNVDQIRKRQNLRYIYHFLRELLLELY